MLRPKSLLGPDGQPLLVNGSGAEVRAEIDRTGIVPGIRNRRGARVQEKFLGGSITSYLRALGGIGLPAELRAQDPITTHPWVYAAAIAIATAASQAPFTVWRESDEEVAARMAKERAKGRASAAPPAGKRRQAIRRHLSGSIERRLNLGGRKGLEADLTHPLAELLDDPNPLQSGDQLFQLTNLFLAVNGEAFWVLAGEDGGPPPATGLPAQIWPLSPNLFEPIFEYGTSGALTGWEIALPDYWPGIKGPGRRLRVPLTDIVQFKLPNPHDPIRGLSRISAAALAIEMDLQVAQHGRSLLRNQGVPKGVVSADVPMSEAEEAEYQERWSETHEGAQNAGRTAFLFNGFTYQTVGLSPADMEHLEQRKWDREEVLAVMGTGPSIVGLTEETNYATAMTQRSNFWTGTVVPQFQMIEGPVDRTLMAEETDRTFGAFDLSGVDALRAGLEHKVGIADRLCGQNLHTTPRAAYEVVGLDVPEYEGDDVCFVGSLSTPVKDVLDPPEPLPMPPGFGPQEPGEEDDEEDTPEGVPDDQDEEGGLPDDDGTAPDDPEEERSADSVSRFFTPRMNRRKAVSGRRWRQFVKIQVASEAAMRRRYRAWVRDERKATLERFDQVASTDARMRSAIKREAISLEVVLPDLQESGANLSEKTRPVYVSTTETVFEFTLDEIGIPTFGIDDSTIVSHWDLRERLFRASVPKTVRDSLFTTLSEGIRAGDGLQQLRVRVGQVYDLSASSSKSLMVARTETASLMNGVRDEMFGLQGFEEEDWVSAGDEATRDDHLTYGEAGPKPRGFNYLELGDSTGKGGVLEYPGDTRAPAGQTINCRCMKQPIA